MDLATIRRRVLREILEDRGLSVADLARLCGWAKTKANKIYNFLNGRAKQLRASTYADISVALNVPIELLLGKMHTSEKKI